MELISPRVRKLGLPPDGIIVLPSELATVNAQLFDTEMVLSGEAPLDLGD